MSQMRLQKKPLAWFPALQSLRPLLEKSNPYLASSVDVGNVFVISTPLYSV